MVGFYQLPGEKLGHRGNIWGVYVDPADRGAGVARALMESTLAHAKGIVSQVHLSVVTDNEAAMGLYERLGFVSYGIEPRALRIGSRFYDEHMTDCRLD